MLSTFQVSFSLISDDDNQDTNCFYNLFCSFYATRRKLLLYLLYTELLRENEEAFFFLRIPVSNDDKKTSVEFQILFFFSFSSSFGRMRLCRCSVASELCDELLNRENRLLGGGHRTVGWKTRAESSCLNYVVEYEFYGILN